MAEVDIEDRKRPIEFHFRVKAISAGTVEGREKIFNGTGLFQANAIHHVETGRHSKICSILVSLVCSTLHGENLLLGSRAAVGPFLRPFELACGFFFCGRG